MQTQIQIQYVQPVYESMEAGQFEIKNGSYSLHQSSPLSWIFKVYQFAYKLCLNENDAQYQGYMGNIFFALGRCSATANFFGAVIKMHGVGRGHGRSLLRRGKKSVNHLSVFLDKCLCLLPIYFQKIIRKIVFFLQKN